MLLTDYRADEVRFAYCYHTYLRWCTYRLHPLVALAGLDLPTLQSLADRFAIRILECHSEPTDIRTLVSLQPHETISACASKLKGQTSKWLHVALQRDQPAKLLARGYFACTAGKSRQEQVDGYLNAQSEHHGYSRRRVPPTFVRSYALDSTAATRLQAQHASTVLRYHLVLATWKRRGVFGPQEGQAIAELWRKLEAERRFALLKVSFLPDHVHVAVQAHPALSPASLAVQLMNAAQRLIWERFRLSAVHAGLERLWQPSAYLGSFGDWATPQLQSYIRNWRARLRK